MDAGQAEDPGRWSRSSAWTTVVGKASSLGARAQDRWDQPQRPSLVGDPG